MPAPVWARVVSPHGRLLFQSYYTGAVVPAFVLHSPGSGPASAHRVWCGFRTRHRVPHGGGMERRRRRLPSLQRRFSLTVLLTLMAALLLASSAAPATVAAPATMAAPPTMAAPGPRAKAGWGWPLEPRPAVVRVFAPGAQPWLSGHRGVDLAARAGDPVHSPAAGTVSFVGWVVDRNVLTILHPDGVRSSFEPLDSPMTVGAAVTAGQVIGTVAAGPHCAPVECLHWGVRVGEDYVNPLQFVLDLRPSVLLPLDGTMPATARSPGRNHAADRLPLSLYIQPVIAGDQTMAEIPVMARPVTRVLISYVPS